MSEETRALVRRYLPDFPVQHCGGLLTDTTEFMDISYGDVIAIDGRYFMVLRDEAERRFGIEDPKYWVKRCQDMETRETKILKLVFHEQFPMIIGDFEILCHRSPEKEARILDLVRGDPRFMQGRSVPDSCGNIVRIIDVIRGNRLDDIVESLAMDHETYFFSRFPDILARFIESCRAISLLHHHLEKHGDIRRDHLWVEAGTGCFKWIDFDYTFDFHENPFGLDIFGLGNVLQFLMGKEIHTLHSLSGRKDGQTVIDRLGPEDFTLMFPNRLANLRKLFPYIPKELNDVLLHFSAGTPVFYESVDELVSDLSSCLTLFP